LIVVAILALSAEAIRMVMDLLPTLKTKIRDNIPKTHFFILEELSRIHIVRKNSRDAILLVEINFHILQDYQEHEKEIVDKFVFILSERMIVHAKSILVRELF
jgi:hypothetical protein